MKKFLLFLIFFPTILYSQTLTINKGKILDVNDSIDFKLEVDSLLNYYTFDELKSESITISLDRVEVKRKYTGWDNPNFETFDVTDRLEDSAKKIILEQEDSTKLIFRKKIDQTFYDYFKIDDNEALVQFKINIEFPNYRYGDDDQERKFFRKNTGSNLGFDCRDTRECFIYFYDRINKSVYTNHYSISNTDIKSNLDAILKEATSDINLVVREDCGSPSNNCDRWTGNNKIRLETPIVEDFTGDGKKDVLGRVYNVYFGDIDWDLTEDEKKMYFSRWALFEAVDVSGDSLVYKLNKYYDQISEGIKVFSLDYNGDGHLDIYTKPDVYHGFQTNKPSGWTLDGFLYINDGSGNFQLSDDDDEIISQTGIKNSEIFQNLIQVDADNELEIVYSQNKFDARYIVAHPHIKLTLIDKVGNNYQKNEVELITEPETGYKILTRDFLDKAVYDINNDGYKDLLVWYSQNEVKENYIDNSGAYIGPNPLTSTILAQQEKRKIIAFHGSSSGFNLDMNASTTKVLYQYNTIPGMEAYSFEIIEFKEGMNLLMIMDISGGEAFNDFGINYDGPNSKISALKLGGNSVEDVTEQIFLGDDNEDYMGARNELLFRDLNNDGLIDMYNWRDIWSQENITQPSQFFINNGTNFIPYHCATNDFGNGGFDLVDFNSDGYYDILYNVDGTFTKSTNIDVAYEVDNDGYLVKKDGEGVLEIIQVLYNDKDDDKIADREDNCIDIYNFDQNDKDKDGLGNKCDPDDDGDEVLDINDNCRLFLNPDQLDTDGDGIGDACDSDDDGDGIKDSKDNCPLTANTNQKDENDNGVGDICDSDLDTDGDGINNKNDNSPYHFNPKQEDIDNDGIGDWSDNSTVLKSISEKFQSDTISFFEDLNLSIEKKYNTNRLIEKIEIRNISDNDNQITIDKEKYILYVSEGHKLEFFTKHLYDFQIDVHNKALNNNEITIDTIDLRLYVDKYIEEKLVDLQKTSIANNLIEYKLINSFEKESDYQEFFDKYGDIPSKWRAPDFETNAYFYDLNNDGYLDLIFGDYRVDVFGRFFNIHHVSVPVYLTHDGDFNFTSRYNDEKNNSINKSVIHSPQIKVLADLNNNGTNEIINFGEEYHIAYPPHHPHINYIHEWFKTKDLEYGIDFSEHGKKTRYYSISENSELKDEVKKINISNTEDSNPNYLRNMYASTAGDIDSDGDIDLISSGTYWNKGFSYDILKNDGNGNFNIESQFFTPSHNTSEGHMIIMDIDNDGNNDVVFGGQMENTKDQFSIFGFFEGNGSSIDFENPIILDQMNPSLGLRSIFYDDINGDDIKELIAYFTVGFGCNGCGLDESDIPNIIKIYELVDESEGYIKDISDQFFNESENYMNFYAQTSFLQYLDLDGDGYKDLIPKFTLEDPELGWDYPSNAFRGNWNNSKGFQYFKYNDNNKKYEKIDIGQFNGLHHYNNFDFADLNNDNSLEWIIFNEHHSESGLYIYQYFFDSDGDGVSDNLDNCPQKANADQLDTDSDGIGDLCDTDDDGDGVLDNEDNCPLTANSDQADWNNNGVGDVCGDPKPLFIENVSFVETIYPNPTDNKLTVIVKSGLEIKDLYFVDFTGKTIKPKSVSRSRDNIDINVSNLNDGIYILEIVSDKEVNKVKIIIER